MDKFVDEEDNKLASTIEQVKKLFAKNKNKNLSTEKILQKLGWTDNPVNRFIIKMALLAMWK